MKGLKRLLAVRAGHAAAPPARRHGGGGRGHGPHADHLQPAVTVAGVDLLDLEGLRVEGTAADDDDSVDVLLRLLGGDDVAAEGYAASTAAASSLAPTASAATTPCRWKRWWAG